MSKVWQHKSSGSVGESYRPIACSSSSSVSLAGWEFLVDKCEELVEEFEEHDGVTLIKYDIYNVVDVIGHLRDAFSRLEVE